MYLGIYLKKNNKTNKQKKKNKQIKTGKKRKKKRRKKERKERAGLQPGTFNSLQLYLTTTRLRLITSLWREVFYLMPFPRKIHRQTPLKMIEPRKTAPLTVKKTTTTTTKTERISWQHEWKNIRCMLYKADTPRLRITMQNICFLISISAVTLKLSVMVKITSIFGSYRVLRIAWHDIFLLSDLSDHFPQFPASWNLYTCSVSPRYLEKSKRKCSSSRQSNPEVNHRTHLKDSSVS